MVRRVVLYVIVMYVAKIFGYDGYIEVNAFITGAISIGIISGAYSTEVFRGAIQSINTGQFEASKVLGLRKKIYYYKIIIPQMLRLALPNISNVWQITLKDTSLISVTGLVEIMRQSYIAACDRPRCCPQSISARFLCLCCSSIVA